MEHKTCLKPPTSIKKWEVHDHWIGLHSVTSTHRDQHYGVEIGLPHRGAADPPHESLHNKHLLRNSKFVGIPIFSLNSPFAHSPFAERIFM